MPRALWPLVQGRPTVEVVLTLSAGGQPWRRTLLADTGAGSAGAVFELILEEADCLLCGNALALSVRLRGAYPGHFPTYMVRVQLPALGFDQDVRAVGVPAGPRGLHGIACFPFLNRFTYGNFGDATRFGLET
jgi:hypothetical protein